MRLPVLGLTMLLAACASTPEEKPTSGWGGIVEQEIEPPPPLAGRLTVPTPSVTPYPVREFSPEEQAFLDRAWAAFRKGDPSWEQLRVQWYDLGPEAAGVLAENLYRAMVLSRRKGALHLVEVAKKELMGLGDTAVPVVIGGLSVRATKTPEGEEVRVGQEALHDAAEIASFIGEGAVPGLLDIAGCGEPSLSREAIWALGNIADPRAEEALVRLAADANIYVRAEALLALRRYGSPGAGARLVAALGDPDGFVAERAARAIVAGKRTDVLPAVVDLLDRAVSEGNVRAARECVNALSGVTGEKIGPDAAEWRRALKGN